MRTELLTHVLPELYEPPVTWRGWKRRWLSPELDLHQAEELLHRFPRTAVLQEWIEQMVFLLRLADKNDGLAGDNDSIRRKAFDVLSARLFSGQPSILDFVSFHPALMHAIITFFGGHNSARGMRNVDWRPMSQMGRSHHTAAHFLQNLCELLWELGPSSGFRPIVLAILYFHGELTNFVSARLQYCSSREDWIREHFAKPHMQTLLNLAVAKDGTYECALLAGSEAALLHKIFSATLEVSLAG